MESKETKYKKRENKVVNSFVAIGLTAGLVAAAKIDYNIYSFMTDFMQNIGLTGLGHLLGYSAIGATTLMVPTLGVLAGTLAAIVGTGPIVKAIETIDSIKETETFKNIENKISGLRDKFLGQTNTNESALKLN